MYHRQSSRLNRIAIIASGAMLLFGGAARAQTVQIFDDAPSIEQLRSIMVPEAKPSLTRRIVIPQLDSGGQSDAVQRVSTQVTPAPRTPVQAEAAQPANAVVADAAQPPAEATHDNAESQPTGVGFLIQFGFNSAVPIDSAKNVRMVEVVAQLMKESPQMKVRVEGHTDSIGSASYNLSLSERRALAIGEYLVKLGIEPSRLIPVGKGMSDPLPSKNPDDPANRRVQFVRVG